jgi:hypothetical protein
MSEFEHLSVLISIVIGLGLTQLLTDTHKLVQARERVAPYWLPIVWSILLFIAMVEWWWASWTFQNLQFNFVFYLFILLSPIALYLAVAFVLPDVEANNAQIDMRVYYFATSKFFFALLALSTFLDAIRRAVQTGSVTDFGAVSNAISSGLLVSMGVSKNPFYHTLVTLGVAGLFIYFIISSAMQLGSN